ncbi:MAG: hypothetical protein V3V35_09825 [Dehalococcoidia bacterium]
MWREILRWCTPPGGWLLAALAFVVAAGVATPLVAEAATVDVWNLGAQVTDLRIGPSDEVWTMTGGAPRKLDPTTNDVTTYSHPLAGTGVLAVDGAGMAWSPDSYSTAPGMAFVISRLDPATLEVKSWPVDTAGVAASIAVDAAGDVWFGKSTTAVWRLNPASNTITEWTLPISVNVQSFDSAGQVWLSYSGGVAMLDPSTPSDLTYWAAPSGTWGTPVPDASGNAWFPVTYSGTDAIARLEPTGVNANRVTEWPCRAGCDELTAVRPDSTGKVWFTEDGIPAGRGAGTSYLGWVDPAADPPAFSEWPLTCSNVLDISCGTEVPMQPRRLRFDAAGNVWMYFGATYGATYYRVARLTP